MRAQGKLIGSSEFNASILRRPRPLYTRAGRQEITAPWHILPLKDGQSLSGLDIRRMLTARERTLPIARRRSY